MLKTIAMLAACAAAALALCGSAAQAQQTAASDDATPVFRISTNLVLLDATVRDAKTGALAGGLDAGSFQLREDGQPQAITYFSRDQLPLSVVFLFDLTETVRPILKPLAEGAAEMLKHLKPDDEVSVMVFSSHTKLLQDFTTDRALAASAIAAASEMKTTDGTFIHEDMYEAVEQAQRSTVPQSRRVLVWLTDGSANFENSRTQKIMGKEAPAKLHTKEEATDLLLHSGVAVAALIDRSAATDAVMAMPFLVAARTGDIKNYAEMTGGPVLKTSKTQVAARLAEMIDDLRGRYTMGYKPTADRPAGTFCKVQLTLTGEAYKEYPQLKSEKIVVETRRGYFR